MGDVPVLDQAIEAGSHPAVHSTSDAFRIIIEEIAGKICSFIVCGPKRCCQVSIDINAIPGSAGHDGHGLLTMVPTLSDGHFAVFEPSIRIGNNGCDPQQAAARMQCCGLRLPTRMLRWRLLCLLEGMRRLVGMNR